MKLIVIASGLIILPYLLSAQVDALKDLSNSNAGGGTEGAGACLEICTDPACISGGTQCFIHSGEVFQAIWKEHEKQMQTKPENRFVSYFEAGVWLGYHPAKYVLPTPKIRGQIGLWGLELRYQSIVNYKLNDNFDYIDLQILQLNWVNQKVFNFRTGAGVSFEQYSGKMFGEITVGLQGRISRERWLIDSEFRISKDFTTGATPRVEVTLPVSREIVRGKDVRLYGSLGGFYNHYYSNADSGGEKIFGILAGLRFYVF
jgi:hypothetical protein